MIKNSVSTFYTIRKSRGLTRIFSHYSGIKTEKGEGGGAPYNRANSNLFT